jgi:hypothetical protein
MNPQHSLKETLKETLKLRSVVQFTASHNLDIEALAQCPAKQPLERIIEPNAIPICR